MDIAKKKLDDFIAAAEKIVEANSKPEEDLFGEMKNPDKIRDIFDLPLQDPNKSYVLYYNNIRKFLNAFIPKDNMIRNVIFEEVNIMLAHKELSRITYGIRNADSRMATTKDMENIIDVLTDWSVTPNEYLKLAYLLLQKNKELGYVPQEREWRDYVKIQKK